MTPTRNHHPVHALRRCSPWWLFLALAGVGLAEPRAVCIDYAASR